MQSSESSTDQLIRQAADGDQQAVERLLALHRPRLRQMVAIRMDKRLAARVDPSDIVQEAMADATQKLNKYLQDQPLPFYPWLRQLAFERLIQQQRHHIDAQGRSVTREQPPEMFLPDHSSVQLVDRLLGRDTNASDRLARKELREKVHRRLSNLSGPDREVLVLRYLEQLSISEAAAVMGLSVEGVRSRQRRALQRFSRLMANHREEDSA